MSHGAPALIGTRGRFTDSPADHENVIPSLNNSPPWVGGVYINVRNTSDNVPILMHDATVDRTTDGSGSVSSLSLAQIKSLDAGDGAEVPTLEEYLDAILDLEASQPTRRSLSRIFLNARSEGMSAIAATFAAATAPKFTSIVDRYIWIFTLTSSTTGAANVRSLDANASIGTFFGGFSTATGPDMVADLIDLASSVGAETAMVFPGASAIFPEALTMLTSAGFDVGISRVNELARIAFFYRNPDVGDLFCWRADELVYWNTDAPMSDLTGHGTADPGEPSHVLG